MRSLRNDCAATILQGGGQGKEGLGAGDGKKEPCLGFPSGRRFPSKVKPEARRKASRRQTTAARTRARFSQRALGLEGAWEVLAGLLGGYDETDTSSPPSGNGGAWDLDVPWDRLGAAADNLFAKTMVVGASSRCCQDGERHAGSMTPRGQKRLNDIHGAALANKKCTMSAHTALQRPANPRCRSCVHLGAKGLRTQLGCGT